MSSNEHQQINKVSFRNFREDLIYKFLEKLSVSNNIKRRGKENERYGLSETWNIHTIKQSKKESINPMFTRGNPKLGTTI